MKKWTFSIFALACMFMAALINIPVHAEVSGAYEYEILTDGTAAIAVYHGTATDVEVPQTIEGYTVTGIKSGAFLDNTSMESLVLPDTVTTIGSEAFGGCISLKSIGLPSGLRQISNSMFYECAALEEIQMPETLERIEPFAFYGCVSLKELILPPGITNIRYNAFDSCTGLQSITLPKSLAQLGDQVFAGCISLSEIKISENNLYFQCVDGILYSKDGTKLLQCPSALEQKNCVVPETVTTIVAYAFENVKSVEKIYIPASVTTIEENAFYGMGEEVIICGEEGSAAARYAEENGITLKIETYVKAESVSVTPKTAYMEKIGETLALKLVTEPADATEEVITWSSSDPSVAVVDENGVVTAKKDGLTIVTARRGDLSSYCQVYVNTAGTSTEAEKPGTDQSEITASFDQSVYQIYATEKIRAKLVSSQTQDAFASLTSGNPAVATVAADGTITGVKAGMTTITAATKSGKTISASVKVVTPKVTLNAAAAPLQVKKSTAAIKIKTKLDTDSVVKWFSSNTKILTVNAKTGKIKAKKIGKAYVIVTMKSGATAKCKITVQKRPVKLKKITTSCSNLNFTLSSGVKTAVITAEKNPVTATEKVTFASSNKKVVAVTNKGKVTAKKAGKAVITVKAGKKTKKIKVTVKK